MDSDLRTLCKSQALENPSNCCQPDGEPCLACRRLQESEQDIYAAKNSPLRALERQGELEKAVKYIHGPFARLPVEIACYIFKFCLRPIPSAEDSVMGEAWSAIREIPFQFTLGSVCQSWRNIVWSHASFWNYIWFTVSTKTRPSFASLIDEWLSRSGQMPLIIYAMFLGEDVGVGSSKLARVLNTYSNRWSFLASHMPNDFVEQLRYDSTQLSLESLILSAPSASSHQRLNNIFKLGVTPSPKFLSIDGYRRFRNVRINYNNLTHFRGRYISASDCILLLCHSPKLRKCSFIVPSGSVAQLNPVVHRSLEFIEIIDAPNTMIDLLSFPILQEIIIITKDGVPAILPFIQRSSHFLKSVAITDPDADKDAQELIRLFQLTPSLERLELIDTWIGDNFFRHLEETASVHEGQPTPFLPNLQLLRIANTVNFEWSSLHRLKTVQCSQPSMKTRPLKRIKVEIYVDFEGPPQSTSGDSEQDNKPPPMTMRESIDLEDLEKILDIIASGIDLQVRNDSGEDLIKKNQSLHHTSGMSNCDL